MAKYWDWMRNACFSVVGILILIPLYYERYELTDGILIKWWFTYLLALCAVILGSCCQWRYERTDEQDRCRHAGNYEKLQLHVANATHVCVKCGHRINRGTTTKPWIIYTTTHTTTPWCISNNGGFSVKSEDIINSEAGQIQLKGAKSLRETTLKGPQNVTTHNKRRRN